MSALTIKIRPAKQTDLDSINQIIEIAIVSWNLPERVKRLSLPSYRYTLLDFEHFEFTVAEDEQQNIVAIAAWEQADIKDTPEHQPGLLLHGLYVQPEAQNKGIAKRLLQEAEKVARNQNLSGILVKAQTNAESYFLKQGMHILDIKDDSRDYAHRLWKPVSH